MIFASTITKKGQITIPIEIRRGFGLKEGGKVFIETIKDEGTITIRPKKSIFDLAGQFKPTKVESAVLMREKMAKAYSPR